jgi:hypothetical protein
MPENKVLPMRFLKTT